MSNTDTGDTKPDDSLERIPLTPAPREALIATAINFLQNPNVRRSPVSQKQKFLRSKGLTEDEIQIACDRAGVFTTDPNSTIINMGFNAQPPPPISYLVQQKQSTLARIKEVLSSLALVSGLAYGIYLFYKKFIEPFLFGRKKKSVEETIEEMDKKVERQIKDLNTEIVKVREEVNRNNCTDTINREFLSFKGDLEAIKGLLLNRKQFAAPIPLVPPSIPAWQLNAQQHAEIEPDKNDDAGSGSGSSETEVVTKNSDSSLEIM